MLAEMSDLTNVVKEKPIEASAPCRIDMGGTLDISTFYLPLTHFEPCTFNIAINLRTRVRLLPFRKGIIRVSSKGFESAEYPLDKAPFEHPLGLMFAVAAYFRADGIHIHIDSSSPPCGALGGSSAAATALVAAFVKGLEQMGKKPISREKIAVLAQALESSVAGVPCGLQDQLAAAFGGVNAWFWKGGIDAPMFEQKIIVGANKLKDLENHLLLAYCGMPHESRDINGRWVRQFLSGQYRQNWAEIIHLTKKFVEALSAGNYKEASLLMNRETKIRKKMTPDVLDEIGEMLVISAAENKCGARFTGAGGGGCVWALGEAADISTLKEIWKEVLLKRKDARILDARIDPDGLNVSMLSNA